MTSFETSAEDLVLVAGATGGVGQLERRFSKSS
jgi:NADPH:quinone reductase-like Zn-dependent oxidoreductase